MRRTITLAVTLAVAGLSVAGCRGGHPGNASDRYGHRHGHDHDHDRDHDHDHYNGRY